jgi:glycosyltransferase involved in cell wall biosynthesis
LHLCAESILNQNFHDFELILVDDGSKDNRGRICEELAKKDERIRVIHKTNGGVSSARNAGLAQSAGDWIVFVDSDDRINDTFLEDHYALIQRNEADLSISGLQMETWDEGKIASLEYYGGKDQLYTVKELLDAKEIDYPTICISGPWCKMYRASIIRNEHLQFDETMALGEDSCFVHAFLEHVKTVVFSSKFHYRYYRGNGDSLFSKYHDNFFENYSQKSPTPIIQLNIFKEVEFSIS